MLKRFLLLIILGFPEGWNAGAQNTDVASNLKAVFIYNFTKYIDWNSFEDDEFSIGVVGPSPIYESLKEIAKTKKVDDKKIVVRYFDKAEEITYCNILFISTNASPSVASVLSKAGKGTLTIGEEAGLARQGVAFNFVLISDKLKFEANVKSINAAGLKASSQLLKLAIIVD